MNINNIFNLFNEPEVEESGNETADKLYQMFREHPLVKIGMFKKIISNYRNTGDEFLETFKKLDNSLNLKEVKRAGDFIMNNRAWEYIKWIDISKEFYLNTLISVSTVELKDNLEYSINYYESIEEYEKCAFLLGIKEKVMNNLK